MAGPASRRFNPLVFLPLLGDSIALFLSGFLAYQIRTSAFFQVDDYLQNPRQYFVLLGMALVIWHTLLAWKGGYAQRLLIFRIDELLLQFQTSIILLLLLMSATFLYHSYDFSRLILFFSWILFVLLGSLSRQVTHRIREFLHRKGMFRRKVILAGSGPKLGLFRKRILENPSLGIDLHELPSIETPLETVLSENPIDELFLFGEEVAYDRIWRLREASANQGLTIHLVPRFGNLYLRNLSGGFFDGTVMISLDSPSVKSLTLLVKRSIDIAVSILFLLLLSPIMLLLAILIKLDSPGPVFFRQRRIGIEGREFDMSKFRSMFEDTPAYALTPTEREDPRITRMGRFLRSSGLDELPQLWNVARGDMSLVGPRPEMPFIVEKYSDFERKRLKVKPGITGLWQVYARTANLPIHDHVEYDLYYIENFSFSLDLMILLDTIPTLILRTGI